MPLPDCYCWLLYTLIYKLEIYLASQGRIHPPTSDLCDSAIWRTFSVPTNVQNKAWMLQNLAAPHGLLIFELSLGIEDDLLLLWFCGFPRLLLRPTWEPLIFLVGWVGGAYSSLWWGIFLLTLMRVFCVISRLSVAFPMLPLHFVWIETRIPRTNWRYYVPSRWLLAHIALQYSVLTPVGTWPAASQHDRRSDHKIKPQWFNNI